MLGSYYPVVRRILFMGLAGFMALLGVALGWPWWGVGMLTGGALGVLLVYDRWLLAREYAVVLPASQSDHES